MNAILSLGNRILVFINKLNKLKDVWLESQIKAYITDRKVNKVTRRQKRLKIILEKKKKITEKLILIMRLNLLIISGLLLIAGKLAEILHLFSVIFIIVIALISTLPNNYFKTTIANQISIIRAQLAFMVMPILFIESITQLEILIAPSLFLFFLAAFLDLIDGPTARALDEISEFGKIIDPLADKILLASVLLTLGTKYLTPYVFFSIVYLESFLVIIAIIKKIIKHLPIAMASQANMAGKIKNIVELVAGGFLFLCPLSTSFTGISNILFIVSIPLALGSIFGYLGSVRRIKKPHLL